MIALFPAAWWVLIFLTAIVLALLVDTARTRRRMRDDWANEAHSWED